MIRTINQRKERSKELVGAFVFISDKNHTSYGESFWVDYCKNGRIYGKINPNSFKKYNVKAQSNQVKLVARRVSDLTNSKQTHKRQTTKMQKGTFAIKNANGVSVHIDGRHFKRTGEDVDRIYTLAQNLRQAEKALSNAQGEIQVAAEKEQVEEFKTELMGILEPAHRFVEAGILERDRQGNVYLEGSNVPVPQELADTIAEYAENDWDTNPLVNFWKLCLLNPNEEARDDFFQYCQDYGITITDAGYGVFYKAVEELNEPDINWDVQTFVAQEVVNVKNNSQSPKRYTVYMIESEEEIDEEGNKGIVLGNYDTVSNGLYASKTELTGKYDGAVTEVGNLQELFDEINELETDAEYVSHHSSDFEYSLGEPASMPREDCDDNRSRGCSRGLHIGSHSYVSSFARRDSIILVCLVNPKDIVCIPRHDNSKIRACRVFPYGIVERDENGDWEEVESAYWEEDFAEYEINDLEEEYDALINENRDNLSIEEVDEHEEIIRERLVDLR